jgi:hypothetical protein
MLHFDHIQPDLSRTGRFQKPARAGFSCVSCLHQLQNLVYTLQYTHDQGAIKTRFYTNMHVLSHY